MNNNDYIQTNKKNDSHGYAMMSSDEKKKKIYRKNTIDEVNFSTNNILCRRRCGQSALELYECSQIRLHLSSSSSSSSASSSFTSSHNLLNNSPSPLLSSSHNLPRLPSSAFSTASVITSSVPLLDVFLGGGVFPFHGRSSCSRSSGGVENTGRKGSEGLGQFSGARENLNSPIGIGGGIYELVGPPGSGKTQLSLQWSLNVQLPPHLGGLSRHAIFIDSEGSATIERLRQIANGLCKRVNTISSIGNDNKQRKKEITFNTIPKITTTTSSSAAMTTTTTTTPSSSTVTTTYPYVNAQDVHNKLQQNDNELKSFQPTSFPSQTNTYNDDDEKNYEGKDEERRKLKKRFRSSPHSSPSRNRSWAATSSDSDIFIHPDDANNISVSKLLEGVKIFRIFDQHELWQIIQALPSLITSSPSSPSLSTTPPHVSSSSSSSTSVGLILLDSLCFPHRLMTSNSFAHRTSHLLRLAAFLRKLAADFRLAIVVTNHLTTQFNSTSSPPPPPPPSFPFCSSSSLTRQSTNDDQNEMRQKYITDDEEENHNSEATLRESETFSFSSTSHLPALGNSWQSIPSVRLQLSWMEGHGGVKVRSIQIAKTSTFSAARERIAKFRIEDEGIKGEEEEEAFWGLRKEKDIVG